MNERDFCFWLRGFVELNGSDNGITAEQWKIIKDHLDLVHNKVTPDYTIVSTGESSAGQVRGYHSVLDIKTPISC